MADRITTTVPLVFKVWGQPIIVEGYSTVDVPSASAFAPQHITNVIPGGGTLTASGHAQPGGPFRQR
jgi:hypothetical protein